MAIGKIPNLPHNFVPEAPSVPNIPMAKPLGVFHETIVPEHEPSPAQPYFGNPGGGWIKAETPPASGAFTPAAGGGFWVKAGAESPAESNPEPGSVVHNGTPWEGAVNGPIGEANAAIGTIGSNVAPEGAPPAGGWAGVLNDESAAPDLQSSATGSMGGGGWVHAAEPPSSGAFTAAGGGGYWVKGGTATEIPLPQMSNAEAATPHAPATAGSEGSFGWVKVDTPPPSGSYTPAAGGGFWVRGGANLEASASGGNGHAAIPSAAMEHSLPQDAQQPIVPGAEPSYGHNGGLTPNPDATQGDPDAPSHLSGFQSSDSAEGAPASPGAESHSPANPFAELSEMESSRHAAATEVSGQTIPDPDASQHTNPFSDPSGSDGFGQASAEEGSIPRTPGSETSDYTNPFSDSSESDSFGQGSAEKGGIPGTPGSDKFDTNPFASSTEISTSGHAFGNGIKPPPPPSYDELFPSHDDGANGEKGQSPVAGHTILSPSQELPHTPLDRDGGASTGANGADVTTQTDEASHSASFNPLMAAGAGAAGLAASVVGLNALGALLSGGDPSGADGSGADGSDITPIDDPLLTQSLNDPGSPTDYSI